MFKVYGLAFGYRFWGLAFWASGMWFLGCNDLEYAYHLGITAPKEKMAICEGLKAP